VIAVVVYATPISEGDPVTAQVTTQDVPGKGRERQVFVTAKLTPKDAADDAHWFLVTAWQGEEGRSIVSPLKEIAPGVWRSQEPLPVHGSWKATLRLHRGTAVQGLGVYFPEDKAIPAPAVPATRSFTRPFMEDKKLLQREQKPGTSGFLTLIGYLVVLAIAVILVGSIAIGLRRLEAVTSRPGAPVPEKPAETDVDAAAGDQRDRRFGAGAAGEQSGKAGQEPQRFVSH
jgi:hypothetical protein